MPRTARIKYYDSIYHIMIRSVGDINLYKDKLDKEKYLQLLKRYQMKFGFKVYSYCLMDNHGHILVDSNGADISKIMHGINQTYAQYYNRKYNRNGHVFGDRFKSKIVTDDRYLITLSAYIHNNAKDLKRWAKNPEKYPYSSLSIYLGFEKDKYDLLDEKFILELFSKILEDSRELYKKLLNNRDVEIEKNVEFKCEKTEYRSERVIIVRNTTPREIIEFVSRYTKLDKRKITVKYDRESTESKALSIFLMRRFCDITIKEICNEIGNITQSRVSKLCKYGLEIVMKKETYKGIIDDFIKEKAI